MKSHKHNIDFLKLLVFKFSILHKKEKGNLDILPKSCFNKKLSLNLTPILSRI